MERNSPDLYMDSILYYFSVIMPVALYLLYIYYFLPYRDLQFDTYTDGLFMVLKMAWLSGILMVPVSFVAWLLLGSPLKKDEENIRNYERQGWNQDKKIVVTYVSKGENIEALNRSICSSYILLKAMKVNFTIEAVTDVSVEDKIKCKGDNLRLHQVPDTYDTEFGAKFKARALHYAIGERNKVQDTKNAWILHLDEESVLTPEAIAGISKFINNPKNFNAIGQGEIKYNAYGYFDNIFIGAIDSIRTGDDLGRFRFQFKILETPLSGMHGSFMLIPASIEHKIGFDLGGRGSITEDAYFALMASDKGHKFRWVDGYIREQSPFSLKDLIKQRRRWLCGLNTLAFDREISFRRRFYLMMSLALWKISWISVFVTIANFLLGGTFFPLSLIIISAIMTGGYFSAYMVGVYRNLMDVDFSITKKIFLYMITFVLVPISAFVEGVAVVYAIVSPVKGFEVVKK